jgi:hypothetical protein
VSAHYRVEVDTELLLEGVLADSLLDPCQSGAFFSVYDEDGHHLIDFEVEH